jgi:tetratricopeptide (TPR) repeat protein
VAAPTFRSRRLERLNVKRPRLRRGRPGSRSKRPKPRWRGVIGWSIGIVAGLAALVGLAHLHGNPPDAGDGFPSPALATLAKPGVAALATFGALVLLAWCVRRLRLEFLAWWPGRIVVQNFVPSGDTPAAEVERLTAAFRDRLGMSHLQSPASVPAPAEQGDFLDVLARNGVDSGNLLGSLLSLLRAAVPTHAYEVSGALVTRKGRRPYGVTVHVVRAPGKGGGGHTVWDTSWTGAVRQAADHATAAILPRTRVCRSPWSAWRRYYMPPALLQHYEHAAECEHDRRYDEALAHYYQALDLDPMNHGLRLQIGFLQEKLGLYLDALDTYGAILEVAEPSSSHDLVRRSYRWAARRERDRTLLVARYRYAVLLGGPGLPRQWRKLQTGSQSTSRDEERERLRDRLAPTLKGLFEEALDSREVIATAAPVYEEAERSLPPTERCEGSLRVGAQATQDAARLPELFLLASLDRLADLRRRIPPSRPWRRPPLTRAAVMLSTLVVRERLRLDLCGSHCERDIQRLCAEISSIEPASGFERWQEHYNVACMWALPLLENGSGDPEKLACLAVERLECATERGDTEFLVSRRDWLVSEDPDLRGLRAQPRFKSFEAAYFPSAARTPQRPRDVHRWEVSRYTLELVRAAAQRWEDTWEKRARELEPVTSMRLLLRWCEDELSARRLIRDVALHHRDWRTRFELLDRMRGWSVEYGFDPIDVAFPDFPAEREPRGDSDDVERATSAAIRDKDLRLSEVVRQLDLAEYRAGRSREAGRLRASRLLDELGARRARMGQRGTFERGLPRAHAGRLCDLHVTLWRRLGELVTPDAERENASDQLAGALSDTAAACRSVADQWSTGTRPREAAAGTNGTGPARDQPVPSG